MELGGATCRLNAGLSCFRAHPDRTPCVDGRFPSSDSLLNVICVSLLRFDAWVGPTFRHRRSGSSLHPKADTLWVDNEDSSNGPHRFLQHQRPHAPIANCSACACSRRLVSKLLCRRSALLTCVNLRTSAAASTSKTFIEQAASLSTASAAARANRELLMAWIVFFASFAPTSSFDRRDASGRSDPWS